MKKQLENSFVYISFGSVIIAWFPFILFFMGWNIPGSFIEIVTPFFLILGVLFGILGILRSNSKKVISAILIMISLVSLILYLTVIAVSGMSGS